MKRALRGALLVAVCASACKPQSSTGKADAAAAAPPPAAAASGPGGSGALKRPPHPAMATSQHGKAALEALAAASTLVVKDANANKEAYAKLGSMEDGCEHDAQEVFTASYKAAKNDATQVEAAGGLMLSLVLNPEPAGYSERLVDAYGMQLMLAGNPLAGAPVASARALVMGAAGRVEDARLLAKNLKDGKFKDAWIRHNESQAWFFIRQRGEALNAINAAAALPDAFPRIFYERARLQLNMREFGAAATDAGRAVAASPRCTRCRILHAQAVALGPMRDDGLKLLDAVLTEQLPSYLAAEAHVAAAVALAHAGKAAEAQTHVDALHGVKEFQAEAAATGGLVAMQEGNAAQAVVALDSAVKMLAPGWLRAETLLALARAAVKEKNGDRALAALKALEIDEGQSAESSEILGDALDLIGKPKDAADARLRAHVLDPYSTARAKAGGRAARGGGDAARDAAARGWRFLGLGAWNQAIDAFKQAESSDATNPYTAYGRMLAQLGLDSALPVGESPGDASHKAAAEAVKRAGKDPLPKVFPADARRALLDVLDEGDRKLTLDAIKKFVKDPDPGIAKLAEEAAARPAPRPRATAR